MRKEAWRATFIRFEVRELVTEHRVERLAHARDHEGIGRRAAEHKKNFAIPFENIPDHFARTMCPWVFAVTGCVPAIGLFQRLPDFRTNPGIVVAGELATRGVGRFHASNLCWCAPVFQTTLLSVL